MGWVWLNFEGFIRGGRSCFVRFYYSHARPIPSLPFPPPSFHMLFPTPPHMCYSPPHPIRTPHSPLSHLFPLSKNPRIACQTPSPQNRNPVVTPPPPPHPKLYTHTPPKNLPISTPHTPSPSPPHLRTTTPPPLIFYFFREKDVF